MNKPSRKPEFSQSHKKIPMKAKLTTSTILTVGILATGLFTPVRADVVVTQTTGWDDGNQGLTPDTDTAVVAFDIANANSILIATVYIDNNPANYNVSNVRFGDGTGIGNGDVAPTVTFSDSRLLSYVFINPSTASGLSFRLDSAGGSGLGVILYEVSGANTDPDSITTVTGVNSITTTTPDELIVSFVGRNGAVAPTVNSNSIFTTQDESYNTMRGGGSIASASATAPAVGSNNITWNNAQDGRIAYAFEASADAGLTFSLTITKNPDTPGTFDFEWASQPGKLYDLLTSTDLADPISEWPIYDDGETVYGAIPTAGETTTLTAVPSSDPRRFFALREYDAPPPPPLLNVDFEDDNGGFTTSTDAGTAWEWGTPTSTGFGGTVSAGNDGSAKCWGTGIGNPGFYANPTTNSRLISPGIDLTSVAAAELSFAHAIDLVSTDSAVVRVFNTDTDEEIVGGAFPLTISDDNLSAAPWEASGPLVLPVGAPIRIEWILSGTGGTTEDFMGWYIDDVLVTETTP